MMTKPTKILKFPDIKITKRARKIGEEAEHWYNAGFEWETSVVAATIYLRMDKLQRRIARLEGKKLKRNSIRFASKRICDNVVLLRDNVK